MHNDKFKKLIDFEYTLPEFNSIEEINTYYEKIFRSLTESKNTFPPKILESLNVKVKEEYDQTVQDFYNSLREESKIRSQIKKQKIADYKARLSLYRQDKILTRSEVLFSEKKELRLKKFERFRNFLLDTKLSFKTFWKGFRLLLWSAFFDTRFEKAEISTLKSNLKKISKGHLNKIRVYTETEPLESFLKPLDECLDKLLKEPSEKPLSIEEEPPKDNKEGLEEGPTEEELMEEEPLTPF